MFQTSGEDVTALGLNERLCHSDPCQHFLTDWLPETQQQLNNFFFLFIFFFLFPLFLFSFFVFSLFSPFFPFSPFSAEQILILFWKVNDTVNLIGHFSAIMWVLKVM